MWLWRTRLARGQWRLGLVDQRASPSCAQQTVRSRQDGQCTHTSHQQWSESAATAREGWVALIIPVACGGLERTHVASRH